MLFKVRLKSQEQVGARATRVNVLNAFVPSAIGSIARDEDVRSVVTVLGSLLDRGFASWITCLEIPEANAETGSLAPIRDVAKPLFPNPIKPKQHRTNTDTVDRIGTHRIKVIAVKNLVAMDDEVFAPVAAKIEPISACRCRMQLNALPLRAIERWIDEDVRRAVPMMPDLVTVDRLMSIDGQVANLFVLCWIFERRHLAISPLPYDL